MNTFKKMGMVVMSLVVCLAFTACEKECNHIKTDYSKDIVGTWTCLQNDIAHALQIGVDGSVVSSGYKDGSFWMEKKGTAKVDWDNISFVYEDGKQIQCKFQVISGAMLAITDENGKRAVYRYCNEDLSDDVLGTWVCTDGLDDGERNTMVKTFRRDGKSVLSGFSHVEGKFVVNSEANYKVIGDLLLMEVPEEPVEGLPPYVCSKLSYYPDASESGDVLVQMQYINKPGSSLTSSISFLRVKEYLDLPDNKYGYSGVYISNVKGLDQDMEFMGYKINFSKMDGSVIDKMLATLMFGVEFPTADTIRYSCFYNRERLYLDAPIAVDGNKISVLMNRKNSFYRDVDIYMFQNATNSQLHMYMPTKSFVNFFANMQVSVMEQTGNLDFTDADAVAAVYKMIDDAVESINLSLVLKRKMIGD